MPKDSRLTDPSDYLRPSQKFFQRKLRSNVDYASVFGVNADSGEPPFTLNRLGSDQLTNNLVTQKLERNARLNFIGDSPDANAEAFELFTGLGRFDRDMYDFATGKPIIENRFTNDPIYQEQIDKWTELYKFSPVVEKKVKSKMPSEINPDPMNITLNSITNLVEDEVSGNVSIASLMSKNKSSDDKDIKETKDDKDIKETKDDKDIKETKKT